MRRTFVVVVLGLWLGTPPGWASAQQGTADIAGRVLDEQGADANQSEQRVELIRKL